MASKKKMISDLKKSGMTDKEIKDFTDNLNPLALESFYADMRSIGTFEPVKKAMGGVMRNRGGMFKGTY